MLSNLEKRMLKPFIGYLEERNEYQQGKFSTARKSHL